MNPDSLRAVLYATLPQLPAVLACLLGCALVVANWKRLSGGAIWAVLGFALAAVITATAPASQILLQGWVIQRALPMSEMTRVFGALGIFWALLRAASFGMLVAGVIVGRPQITGYPTNPPPYPTVPGAHRGVGL